MRSIVAIDYCDLRKFTLNDTEVIPLLPPPFSSSFFSSTPFHCDFWVFFARRRVTPRALSLHSISWCLVLPHASKATTSRSHSSSRIDRPSRRTKLSLNRAVKSTEEKNRCSERREERTREAWGAVFATDSRGMNASARLDLYRGLDIASCEETMNEKIQAHW